VDVLEMGLEGPATAIPGATKTTQKM